MDHDQVVRMTQMIEEAVTFGIRSGLPDAKERRNYQLLQAAATLAGSKLSKDPVTEALVFLAEIERRESL